MDAMFVVECSILSDPTMGLADPKVCGQNIFHVFMKPTSR